MMPITQLRAEPPALGPAFTLATPRLRPLTPTQVRARDAILAADRTDDYESVACLCGDEGDEIVLSQVERHGLPYRKVACRVCGLLRVTPRWTAARYGRFYEHEYRDLYNPVVGSKTQFAQTQTSSPWLRALAAWVVAGYARFGTAQSQPQIVEIGAGGGWNLGLLPATWERIGYDVDREYLAIGEELFGCTMRYGFVADAKDAVAAAQLVLLSHVVEHFSDPVGELGLLAQAMPPDGLLLIEVPGIFRLHRTNLDVMSYMQNAHTFTFCAATLRAVCEQAGLEVLDIDETVRAICRPLRAVQQLPAAVGYAAGLAANTTSYLRRCEAGYRAMKSFARIPLLGRYLAAVWRRVYFPILGRTTSA